MLRRLATLLTLTCACATQDESGFGEASRSFADTGLDSASDVATPWDISSQGGDGTGCSGPTPGQDSDNDGLLDVVEDRNLNCLVDADETDPYSADTDGDGLTDADEDVDRNGRVDLRRGETSPVIADTDGDGLLDGEERLGRVCRASVIGDTVRSRITLGSGRVVSTSPEWSPIPMLGPEEVALVTGPEDQAAAWFALPPREGEMFISQLLNPWQDDDRTLLPLLDASGETSGIWAWEFEVYDSVSPTDWTVALLQDAGFSRVQGVERPEAEPSSEPEESPEMVRLTVRAEFQPAIVTGADADRVLLAVVPDAALLDDWMLATGVARIAPTVDATLEVVCETLVPAAAPSVNFVVVSDTRSESRAILESVARSLGVIMGASPAHIVPADMHLLIGSSGLGGPLPVTFDAIPNVVASWVPQSEDQRLWLNSLAALTLLNLPGEGQKTVLLMISAFEDTEFHIGVTGGRDGDAGQPILPDGMDRTALEGYYAEALRELGVSVVTVSPTAEFDAFGCAPLGALEYVDAYSFQSVAKEAGGIWVNACTASTLGVLARSLAGFAPTRAHYQLGPHVLASSVLGENTLPVGWLPREQTAEGLAVSSRAPVDEVQHVAYLRWAFQ
jgi:hypothetical protein